MGWFGRGGGEEASSSTSTSSSPSPSSSTAAAASQKAEAAAVALQAALESAVDAATMRLVVPLQRKALLCAAACCDSARTRRELDACCSGCTHPVQGAEAAIAASVGAWQRGFSAALENCQRQAESGGGSSSSPASAARLDACVLAAAARFKDSVPQLGKTIAEAVPKAVAMAREHHEMHVRQQKN